MKENRGLTDVLTLLLLASVQFLAHLSGSWQPYITPVPGVPGPLQGSLGTHAHMAYVHTDITTDTWLKVNINLKQNKTKHKEDIGIVPETKQRPSLRSDLLIKNIISRDLESLWIHSFNILKEIGQFFYCCFRNLHSCFWLPFGHSGVLFSSSSWPPWGMQQLYYVMTLTRQSGS